MHLRSGKRYMDAKNVAEEDEMRKKRVRIENYTKHDNTKLTNVSEADRIIQEIPGPECEESQASFTGRSHSSHGNVETTPSALQAATTISSTATSRPVTLHIGTPGVEQIFRVRKDILSIKSRVFATMVDGRNTLANNLVVRLPEDQSNVFMFFLNWVRSGKFLIYNPDDKAATMSFLIDVYIFADKYDIIGLLDQTMTVFIWLVLNYNNAHPTEEQIEHIKENCMESSGLYKFIAFITDVDSNDHGSNVIGLISNKSQSVADQPNTNGIDDKPADSDQVTNSASQQIQHLETLEVRCICTCHRHAEELGCPYPLWSVMGTEHRIMGERIL